MASEKKKETPPAPAFITVRKKDDFNYELIELRAGGAKILLTELFPIVMGKAEEWLSREAGVIT
jgi:hypothetical protein